MGRSWLNFAWYLLKQPHVWPNLLLLLQTIFQKLSSEIRLFPPSNEESIFIIRRSVASHRVRFRRLEPGGSNSEIRPTSEYDSLESAHELGKIRSARFDAGFRTEPLASRFLKILILRGGALGD